MGALTNFHWGDIVEHFLVLGFDYLSSTAPWLEVYNIREKENYSLTPNWPLSFNEPAKFIHKYLLSQLIV